MNMDRRKNTACEVLRSVKCSNLLQTSKAEMLFQTKSLMDCCFVANEASKSASTFGRGFELSHAFSGQRRVNAKQSKHFKADWKSMQAFLSPRPSIGLCSSRQPVKILTCPDKSCKPSSNKHEHTEEQRKTQQQRSDSDMTVLFDRGLETRNF